MNKDERNDSPRKKRTENRNSHVQISPNKCDSSQEIKLFIKPDCTCHPRDTMLNQSDKCPSMRKQLSRTLKDCPECRANCTLVDKDQGEKRSRHLSVDNRHKVKSALHNKRCPNTLRKKSEDKQLYVVKESSNSCNFDENISEISLSKLNDMARSATSCPNCQEFVMCKYVDDAYKARMEREAKLKKEKEQKQAEEAKKKSEGGKGDGKGKKEPPGAGQLYDKATKRMNRVSMNYVRRGPGTLFRNEDDDKRRIGELGKPRKYA